MLTNHRRGLAVAGGMLCAAAGLGLLVAIPATLEVVQRLDDAVWRLAGRARNDPATAVAELFSAIGGVWINWSLRVAAAVFLVFRRRFLQLTAFALAVASSEVLIGTLKAAFDRPRPPSSLVGTTAASFPSGHAIAGAVTAVGLVVVLLPPGVQRWRWEVRAVIFASLMALSRVYLRAHWLTDSLAGALLGGGLALGWPALLQMLRHRPQPWTGPADEQVGGAPSAR